MTAFARTGVLILLIVSATSAGDWPQFLGPNRDGVSAEKDLLAWPKKGPEVLWTHKIGEGYSGPVVAGDKVVVSHRQGDEEIVDCLEVKKGKRQWRHKRKTSYRDALGKGNGPRSTPVIHDGKVYTLGADGWLQCLKMSDGKPVWTKDLVKLYSVPDSYFGVGTTPIVEGKRLLVNVGGEKAGIVAFELKDGKEAWKASDDGASYSSPIAATIDGVRHVLFFTRQGLVSVDPAGGKVRFSLKWRARSNASVNAAVPLLLNKDKLFLTASYQTGAILLEVKKDGVKEVWKNDKTLSCQYNTPVAVGKSLYGINGRQDFGDTELRCIDWSGGKTRWTKSGLGCASIIAAGKKLLLLTESGELILAEADETKYVEKARAKVLASPCRAHPALSDGRFFARNNTKLVCIELKKR